MSRYSECDLSMPPIFNLYRSFASFLTGVSKSLHRIAVTICCITLRELIKNYSKRTFTKFITIFQ
uniref:Uncharacterized protein n=1 Tax=Glossina morsitans morsitans TaxID=37546 RepID=A0A1B0F9K7_GLOMM